MTTKTDSANIGVSLTKELVRIHCTTMTGVQKLRFKSCRIDGPLTSGTKGIFLVTESLVRVKKGKDDIVNKEFSYLESGYKL